MKRTRLPTYARCYILLLTVFFSCSSPAEPPAPEEPKGNEFALPQPANFPAPVYKFSQNPLTKEGFELGRALFYDPLLSLDGTVSCANCHKQPAAFADIDHRVSHGVDNLSGTRNTPPMANMAWQRDFFWDGGANHLEVQPLAPLTNPLEMAETVENVVTKLNASASYRTQFKAVFGKESIDSQQMLKALAQFVGMMVSYNSRYDKHVRNEGVQLTTPELEGLAIFKQKCSSCHATDLFSDGSFRNNGLDTDFSKDEGRSAITHLPQDKGKFRVPTLRNIQVTAPYMHDGRFQTLAQVLQHYDSGVKESATLDPLLSQGNRLGIPLSIEERTRLLAFLNTLTDVEFIADPRFAEQRP